MPYVLQADIKADIPPQFMLEALDDDNDGQEDAGLWDSIAAAVATDIDGILGQRYATPFTDPIPAIVKSSARVMAMAKLYRRRGFADALNPWAEEASKAVTKLNTIAAGNEPLIPGITAAKPNVSAITEPAKTTSAHGHLPC